MKEQVQAGITTLLISQLEKEGYAVRPSKTCLTKVRGHKNPDWNASNAERGVRISIWQSNARAYGCGNDNVRISIRVKLRTEIDAYKLSAKGSIVPNPMQRSGSKAPPTTFGRTQVRGPWRCGYWNIGEYNYKPVGFDEFIAKLAELRGKEPTKKFRKKSDLEPLGFGSTSLVVVGGSAVSIRHFIRLCRCVDIVAINDKLQVSQEGIDKPNAECWFRLEGQDNKEGYNFCIIVNSEMTGFHVLTRRHTKDYKGWQVTDNHKPDNGRLDFTAFTELDRDAVRLAIECFLRKD
jgi:hypothetical protein